MHPDIELAAERLGLSDTLVSLRAAAEHSVKLLDNATAWLTKFLDPSQSQCLDVVVLGSFARQEASSESDFDYLVVAYGIPPNVAMTRDLLKAVDQFIVESFPDTNEPGKKRRPGTTGLFGRITSAADLTERIGLEQDTNLSHSRRVLLLQESVSIYRPDLREQLLRSMLERYLVDYKVPKPGVPRFLANDLIRYWYTLAVDYQAKRWEDAFSFGLRYLKLIISRKIAYAGTMVSILMCREATPDYFLDQFQKPPLARIAQLINLDQDVSPDTIGNILTIAEQFSEYLRDPLRRKEAQSVESLNLEEQPDSFQEMRRKGDNLQVALQDLFFNSFLRDSAQRYLAF